MVESKSSKKTEDTQVTGKPAIVSQEAEATQAESKREEPTREEIAELAYQLWVERGSPHGSHEEDWYQAEEQLRGTPLKKAAGA